MVCKAVPAVKNIYFLFFLTYEIAKKAEMNTMRLLNKKIFEIYMVMPFPMEKIKEKNYKKLYPK
ncbi:MAG: hypothetical protein ACLUPK_05235 [Veillonella sp.]